MGEWSWQRGYDLPFPDSTTTTTTASQKEYSVLNCLRIESLFIASPIQRRLILLPDRNYRKMYPNDTATGTPYYWRLAGRANASTSALDTLKVGLYPIPDAAYTLKWDGVRRISLLSSDTDDVRVQTGMPVTLVDVLIEMATAIGWKEIDDQDASAQMQEVVMRLKALYGADQHNIEDRLIMAPFESDEIDRYFDPQLDPRFNE